MSVSLEQMSDIIKMLGLVTGGLWAAWTFQKLQRVRAAELDNTTKLIAIEKSRIEQLAIQLNVAETAFPTQTFKSFLCVTVTLKNKGEQNLQVDFPVLTVGRIVFGKNGKQTIDDVYRRGPSYFVPESDELQLLPDSRIFKVGQTRQLAFVIPITEPGGYIVQFDAVYGKISGFDSEKPPSEHPVLIHAIEQTVYFATGKPDESASNAKREC